VLISLLSPAIPTDRHFLDPSSSNIEPSLEEKVSSPLVPSAKFLDNWVRDRYFGSCKQKALLAGFEEAFELSNSGRMPHLTERFGLNLADPLARHLELAADLFQRAAIAIHQTKTLL